ncbi:MAG: DNA/RNA nuclease SfsA, partial [Pseudomonadota bacterium]
MNEYDLKWPRLVQGTLVKRYQRFKADVRLRNGRLITAHCPNSGSMLGCSEPGRPVYLSRDVNPRRKLKYTWQIIDMPSSLAGINTLVPNLLVKKVVSDGKIVGLSDYQEIRPEVNYGQGSRIDLLLEKKGERCFVEIKNCTLVDGNIAYFPDAVTSRG